MTHNRKGVTLVELMITIVVIAIAVVGSLEFFKFCQKNFIINSTLKLMASDFARETMEDLYYRDPDDLDLITPKDVSLPSTGDFATLADKGGSRSYTVTQGTDAIHGTKYKVITITVDWTP